MEALRGNGTQPRKDGELRTFCTKAILLGLIRFEIVPSLLARITIDGIRVEKTYGCQSDETIAVVNISPTTPSGGNVMILVYRAPVTDPILCRGQDCGKAVRLDEIRRRSRIK